MDDYVQHIKNSIFATGCAPTFKVHLYTMNIMRKVLWKFLKKEKRVFIFMFEDLLQTMIPNRWENLKKKLHWLATKYLNYLIAKDWTKIDELYFQNALDWEDYLKKHPDRKEYFEKRKKLTTKLVDIYLDQERIDGDFMDKYTKKYMG